ncbi:hypothetical protein [Pedobacter gandavensis]|uniref:hypothetical protein n=1 Tax=Pedobacter gandavensis TaxID=2679963 RepID=UPI0029304F42|nr:hypothetical protein [Pedobacter gandavensis]
MKGKQTQLMDGTAVSNPTEYLILGIDTCIYYVLDESNNVDMLGKSQIEITDESKPEFWIEKDGRLLPEEWFWENFFNLHDSDLSDEWDEIWFITQFAKGLSKFNLPSVPLHFRQAFDKDYKIQLIGNYLEMAGCYDNLVDEYIEHKYTFGKFNDELTCFRWSNNTPEYFTKKLMSIKTSGFNTLKEILEILGESFKNAKININDHWLDIIRNRVLYSIWSLFGTKHFEVYELIDTGHSYSDYMIKYEEETYLLSFESFYG